ncbi:hypothetical protein JYU34_003465 [Plutella xylostella]|uniref:Uncharacterized protein n=2 Tax=Plutella xylostella TaxID=51655 RepID=A0ABQ7R059_PLUXY|nr:hypothetical protein JYU34_003465 [Plutella xylostella]CAG9117558.1 unnamed protein product [Plutella xylostella]
MLYFFTILITLSSCACLKYSSVDTLYKKGVQAYTDERWSECIVQFEEALHLYKLHKSVLNNCRTQCNVPQHTSSIKENIDDLKIYEKYFIQRNCLNDCQDKGFNDLNLYSDIEESVLEKIQMKTPYEFLHVCYFQMNNLPKAASSAYTYLVANPESDQMKNNLQFYIEQQEVDRNEIVDLDGEDWKVLYKLGVRSYNQGNWGETVAAMEEVLTDYITSENSCRVDCEKLPEQQWSSEFVITTSNNMAAILQCKQLCQDKLKFFGYNSGLEFLADILNYLQISYYHLDRFDDAAKMVASHLAILPTDEDMIVNKNIYKTLAKEGAFVERPDIAHYVKRDMYEKILLDIFHQGSNYHINSNFI